MSVPAAYFPYGLGVPNGGNRQALAAAQSSAAQQSYYNALYGAALAGSALGQPLPAAKPEPIADAGIRAGEIRAWRCWRVDDGWLRSTFVNTIWAPGEVQEGKVKTHGVHAWMTMSLAIEYGLSAGREIAVVVGEVDLWGEVIEHEKGYRAEYAKIVSLVAMLHGDEAKLPLLRKRYGLAG